MRNFRCNTGHDPFAILEDRWVINALVPEYELMEMGGHQNFSMELRVKVTWLVTPAGAPL